MVEAGSLILVCGPSRGGKSRWAEHLAACSQLQVHYLATADDHPSDQGWQARIRRHRDRRPPRWTVHLPGNDLAGFVGRFRSGDLLLIDALGTWLARHLDCGTEDWQCLEDSLLTALTATPAAVVLVAEETGWGVVPPTAVGGLFRDRMGMLLERLHRRCDASWLVMHGRAIDLMAHSQAVPEA
ncbi:MAG: bifunctional adenosylcobinamide kinase/adenosylcobinamide-phosphate guanylyltransferase [Cyanobacteriota bacterium]|nr:bifunctional adenosylcobinamide kinase/adenosylcobinamide-phosphate guanylyltransferase [Cyanobacteriota bacterium]